MMFKSEQTHSYSHIQTLEANPQYYDYIHKFELSSINENDTHGKIKLVAGGGQAIDLIAKGEYLINFINENEGVLSIKNLHKIPPCFRKLDNDVNIIKIDDYDNKFKIEYGHYIPGSMFYNKDHMEEKLVVAKSRWVFDNDPLELGNSSREDNLMFMLGDMPDESSEKIYYHQCEIKSRNQLKDEGLNLCNENDNFYFHTIRVNKLSKSDFLKEYNILNNNSLQEIVDVPNEIVSYYDNQGMLIMSYLLSCEKKINLCGLISEFCGKILRFHTFYDTTNSAFLKEVYLDIINKVKQMNFNGIAVVIPISSTNLLDVLKDLPKEENKYVRNGDNFDSSEFKDHIILWFDE